MSYAALVRAMSAAGAPPEAIALALEAIEQRDAADDARRAKARDKKRLQRAGDSPETVPGPSRDMAGTVPTDLPSLDKSPQTPKINPTPQVYVCDPLVCETREEPTPAKPKPRWPKAYPPPAGVSDEAWIGLVEHRVRRRAALTPRAYELLCNRLAELACDEWPPGRLVDLIVERNWLTVEPSWLPHPTGTRNGQRPHQRRSGNGMLDAIIDAERDDRARPSF